MNICSAGQDESMGTGSRLFRCPERLESTRLGNLDLRKGDAHPPARDGAEMEKAAAGYMAAVAECKKEQGDGAKTCMKEAKAAKHKAEAEAKSRPTGSPPALRNNGNPEREASAATAFAGRAIFRGGHARRWLRFASA
jgi:hypothetical protein